MRRLSESPDSAALHPGYEMQAQLTLQNLCVLRAFVVKIFLPSSRLLHVSTSLRRNRNVPALHGRNAPVVAQDV